MGFSPLPKPRSGYLPAAATKDQLVNAMRSVVRGERPCSRGILETILKQLGERPSDDGYIKGPFETQGHLTARDLEVSSW